MVRLKVLGIETQPAKLPPFRSLLKSTEVEDPVNILVHRPLAYAFVWTIFKTPITPNMVTFMAMIAGIASGAMYLWGTAEAMIAAGLLLWTSAILDGADGLLARAKKLHSQFGRALDGWADMIVAFATVFPAFYHMWVKDHDQLQLLLTGPAIALTAIHLWAYDFHKEGYLRLTRPGRGGEGDDPEKVAKLVDEAREKGMLYYVAVAHVLLPYLQKQQKIVSILNPAAFRAREVEATEEIAEIYAKHNRGPMKLWALISLAPHSYLMAICSMFDRLDVYLFIRLVVMNVIFGIVLIWQRRATRATNTELELRGVVLK